MLSQRLSHAGGPGARFFFAGWLSLSLVVAAALAACLPNGQGTPAPTPSQTPPPTLPPPTATGVPSLTPPPATTLPPASPSDTPVPSRTPVPPSATPTARPVTQPTLGYYSITPAADATLVTPFPTPASAVRLESDIVNVLLIGTDYRASERVYRTDTLIIVSINKKSGGVTLLSIPRDLFVYVPTWGMYRINQAYSNGERSQYPGGGPGLLKQTLLYNLGIPIHYYALANFDGFRAVVDTLGGIDVPVTCELAEYKIKDPTLDESLPANYELYTQTVGIAHMDGALALWYARARPVGGDFFRSYRQRQVLRALYHAGLSADLIPQVPALYAQFQDVVQTDLGLWDIMQFAPLAASFDETRLRSLYIGPNHTRSWRTPGGEDVLLPRPDSLPALVADVFATPNPNQLQRPVTRVEIWNASGNPEMDRLAAETLANEGFAPVIGQPDGGAYPLTQIIDFTTSPKGSPIKRLQALVRIADRQIVPQPDASSPVQFRLILGTDYNPCPRLDWLDLPQPTPTPAAASGAGPTPAATDATPSPPEPAVTPTP